MPGASFADRAVREAYDVEIGFERPGEGLEPPEPSGPYPSRHSRLVPDVAGLFYQACLDVAGKVGLRLEPVQLAAHPRPVEGLVAGQTPPPGQRVRRDSVVTVQLWHPPEPGRQQPSAEADPGLPVQQLTTEQADGTRADTRCNET
jgi:beta-lactam-binding protein with PASTA domain